jgi:hypothetical protein
VKFFIGVSVINEIMKRVTREAIKIVTIVRWLAEESGELSLPEDDAEDEADREPDFDEATEAEIRAQFSTYIYCHYILLYRIIDH